MQSPAIPEGPTACARELWLDRLPVGPAGSLSGVTKAQLHELVDALPAESLDAAAILLRRAQDPVIAQLDAAEFEDEPVTAEDRAAIGDARQEPPISWARRRRNSLTEESWRIEIRPAALKSLKRLSRSDRDRTAAAIDRLPDGDIRQLRGVQHTWRLRVGN